MVLSDHRENTGMTYSFSCFNLNRLKNETALIKKSLQLPLNSHIKRSTSSMFINVALCTAVAYNSISIVLYFIIFDVRTFVVLLMAVAAAVVAVVPCVL